MDNFMLFNGRHQIPGVYNSIFGYSVKDIYDVESMRETIHSKLKNQKRVYLYVTGLTIALVEVINYCTKNDIHLTLYHYNRETKDYFTQGVAGTYINKDSAPIREASYA